MTPSTTHLVLIPTYNTGNRLLDTVREALSFWRPVWVIVDGSTDGSDTAVMALAESIEGLRVVRLSSNGGKGTAVLAGGREAFRLGFTHVLVMDADGQHPADRIQDFMTASQARPDSLILGRPIFGAEAPTVRLQGRKLSVGLVHLEIGGAGIDDPLFGFRVYPLKPTLAALASTRWARRYDFDPEIAVRLFWSGVRTENISAKCCYFSKYEGGVSHFDYFRDNLRMVWLHTRLIAEFLLFRWYQLAKVRRSA